MLYARGKVHTDVQGVCTGAHILVGAVSMSWHLPAAIPLDRLASLTLSSQCTALENLHRGILYSSQCACLLCYYLFTCRRATQATPQPRLCDFLFLWRGWRMLCTDIFGAHTPL
jgi:hypothetical protein